ncbi:hypothetical protein [Intrasporangium sp.]|uniref:hypothetical protein n=1 Tax=Intrasporangium sp. TaxID=1925024 RepID=UPI003221C8B3
MADDSSTGPAPTSSGKADGRTDESAPSTILVLTEQTLRTGDVKRILSLHQGEAVTYRVLVPADTRHNVLVSLLNHLTLFEMREALESLSPVNRDEALADAGSALSTSLSEFETLGSTATGEVTADDPMPAVEDEVKRLHAVELVVVTQPLPIQDTFHTDWASRARETLGIPVLHMYAGEWRLG